VSEKLERLEAKRYGKTNKPRKNSKLPDDVSIAALEQGSVISIEDERSPQDAVSLAIRFHRLHKFVERVIVCEMFVARWRAITDVTPEPKPKIMSISRNTSGMLNARAARAASMYTVCTTSVARGIGPCVRFLVTISFGFFFVKPDPRR